MEILFGDKCIEEFPKRLLNIPLSARRIRGSSSVVFESRNRDRYHRYFSGFEVLLSEASNETSTSRTVDVSLKVPAATLAAVQFLLYS